MATSYCQGQVVFTTLTMYTYNHSNFTILKQQQQMIISRMRDMQGLTSKGSNKQQDKELVIYFRIRVKKTPITLEMHLSSSWSSHCSTII